jgi:hypothetical protein
MTDKSIDEFGIDDSAMAFFWCLFEHEACVKSVAHAWERHACSTEEEENAHAVKFLYDFIATEEGYEGEQWVTIVDRMVARITVEGLKEDRGAYRDCAS